MENKSKKRKIIETIEIIIAVGLVACIVGFVASMDVETFEGNIPGENVISEVTTSETLPPEPEIPFEYIHKEKADAFDGELVLVNNSHEYRYADNKEILSPVCDYKTDDYWLLNNDVYLRVPMIEAVNEMITDFKSQLETPETSDRIILLSGYRSVAKQGVLYNEELEKTMQQDSTLVSKPGHSEHHTGYALDFSLYEDGAYVDYMGTGEYQWINDNCYKYGMIMRYIKGKEDITKIQEEPWHFRYIGIPHAYAVVKNEICYEEYIEALKKFSFEKPFTISHENGEKYQVYYVPLEEKSAEVPVPDGFEYSISGNNIDGFIVTVNGIFNDDYSEILVENTEGTTETTEVSENTEETE